MGKTKIEWCEKSWNPITGCSPVSEGCQNCYARRMSNRLKGRYGYPKDEPFKVTFHPDRLEEPLYWKKSSRIFVCSMGDLFHEDVNFDWIMKILDVICVMQEHIFLILTKRPARMMELWFNIGKTKRDYGDFEIWPYPNLWLGVSISTNKDLWMVETLLQISAAKRFVSVEPMLVAISLDRYLFKAGYLKSNEYFFNENRLDWVICGGETGPKARLMHPNWTRSLRDQCQAAEVPFFFKRWGDYEKRYYDSTNTGRLLDGRTWEERPNDRFQKI